MSPYKPKNFMYYLLVSLLVKNIRSRLKGHFVMPTSNKVNFVTSRENEGTERKGQGVGRDMLCPRKLFLDERKSLF